MNFSSRYHIFGQSQTEQVRNSGMKLVSTRQVLRGEIQKALLTLGEVQATTLPTRLVPRCQAQHLPSSLAAPHGGRPPSLAPSASHSSDPRAPGTQGCPSPAACQLPRSSQYMGGCPVLAGRQLALSWQAGRRFGSGAAQLARSRAAQASLPDGQQGGRLPAWPPP